MVLATTLIRVSLLATSILSYFGRGNLFYLLLAADRKLEFSIKSLGAMFLVLWYGI